MRPSPRSRRLCSDQQAMLRLKAESRILDFTLPGPTFDGPPEVYLVAFWGHGLCRVPGTLDVTVRDQHQVLIRLGASYPRMMPELLWKTPIFHPNISSTGIVCLGGYSTHWVPSLRLDQLCEMLWDMIRYRNFDVDSPYNREAAQWARVQTQYAFPLDSRTLRVTMARSGISSGDGDPHQRSYPPSAPRNTAAASRGGRAIRQPPVCEEPEILFVDDGIVEAEVVSEVRESPDIVFIE